MGSPPPSSQWAPPPSSQSHFAQFSNFVPDDHAPFDEEFARLASSQQWVPGSQQYTKQRTIAMREELTSSFFSSSAPAALANDQTTAAQLEHSSGSPASANADTPLTPQQLLRGYQLLCDEVRIPQEDSVPRCKKALKAVLVNIVDLLNVRRTGGAVKIWDDFRAFRTYSLKDGHRIDRKEAKAAPGILASLLQDLGGRGSRNRRGKRKVENALSKVLQGRVGKKVRSKGK